MSAKLSNEAPVQDHSLLIVGQTPPPWHGQAVATQMLFENDWSPRKVRTLRMAYSDEMDEVGRFGFDKLTHLWRLIRQTRRELSTDRNTILFYPPASARWIPFLRDVVYLAAVRRRAAGTVFIFHAAGLPEWISRSRLRRWLAGLAYANADVSLEVAVEDVPAHQVFGIPSWRWCPCAAEVPEMSREVAPDDQPLRALFVGSLQEGKGVLQIVETAALLKQQGLESRFVFKVVGRWFSREFEEETRRRIHELGLESMVLLLGELTGEKKWDAYRDSDVFFFPSHYQSEASPIVVMEALGAGLPVVASDWRGIPALVEGCEGCVLLPIRNPEAYAEALKGLENDRGRLVEFAKGARSFFEARYLPEHFTGRIEEEIDRRWPMQPVGPPRVRTESDAVTVLQVFNQYAEQGGEEVWVDQVTSLTNENLKVHELRFLSRNWKMPGAPSRFKQVLRMWDNPDSRKRLARDSHALNPDALLFHNLIPVGSFALYDEARGLGLPVIQYIHNFRPFSPSGTLWHGGEVRDEALSGNLWPEIMGRAWEHSFRKTAVLAYYLKRLRNSGWLDAVDHWIAISEFMREKFVEAGIPEDKISTLRHCWTPVTSEVSPRDEGYYLFLGRLVPEKGVITLLEAWAKLEARLGEDCPRLIIAGTGPLEEVVTRNRNLKRVEFAGFVSGEAKQRLLRGARALVAPSIWWEPLGLIVYEAYDFGKPVVAAASGGLVETVIPERTGLLHKPGCAESLQSAILSMESLSGEDRARMGRRGRDWLLSEASPERWRNDFISIVRKVSGMNGPQETASETESCHALQ